MCNERNHTVYHIAQNIVKPYVQKHFMT